MPKSSGQIKDGKGLKKFFHGVGVSHPLMERLLREAEKRRCSIEEVLDEMCNPQYLPAGQPLTAEEKEAILDAGSSWDGVDDAVDCAARQLLLNSMIQAGVEHCGLSRDDAKVRDALCWWHMEIADTAKRLLDEFHALQSKAMRKHWDDEKVKS